MVESRGPATFGVTTALIVVATVFVAARFFTRGYIVRSIKNDDWWILAAWICSVGFSVAICVAVSDGLGKHNTDIPDYQKDNLRRAQYAFSILYNPCLMLTKTSIIVFYLSVMSEDVDPVFKWCNWITLALTNVTGAALTFLNIFQCQPIRAGYEYPGPPNPKCTDIVTLYLSSAPVNIITDLALLLLPMPILTGLRLPKKQKIILIVTFSAGAFVAVVDVIRIAYLQEAAISRLSVETGTGGASGGRIVESTDFTWYASLSFMWSAIEVNIGLICACVPSLKPLFLKFAPSFIKDDSDDITPMGSFDNSEKENVNLSTANTDSNVLTNPAAFRRPTIKEYSGEDDGDYMGFLNMLSGPDDDAPLEKTTSSFGSRKSAKTSSRGLSKTATNNSTVSDFGFVKMDSNKNMLKLSNRQSLWAVAVVTIIFFMWGFARGLLDVLNGQFQRITNLSDGEALGLHGVYYAGYFVGPLTLGRFMLHRYGFKSTMMAGLCIYGSGTLVFWPAAVLTSYPAFIVSNFIVGFGLSLLEVAANPYIALCGPLEYAEVRLNFSQAFQAIGQICSPLLAQRVLFKNILNGPSLVNVQWTYLGISLFDFALAIVFYYIPLPEATEDQLEEQADKRSAVYRTRVGPMRVVWVTLIMGVFGQFCYVGGQEGNGGNAGPLVNALIRPGSRLTASDFSVLDATTFAVGRFLGAFLNYLIKPRMILMACFLGIIAVTASQLHAEGYGGIAAVNIGYLFEGSIFPIIFAISMRGMGDQTFNAAALMTASISAGALIPPIVWAVENAHDLKYSYSVMLGVLCFGALFPLYLNLVPAARKQVDPIHENRDRRRRTRKMNKANRQNSAFSDNSVGEVVPEKEFGIKGILARKKRDHEKHVSGVSFMPESQHVERSLSKETADSAISPKHSVNPWNDDAWDKLDAPEPAHMKSAGSNVAALSSWTGSTSSDEGKNFSEKKDFGDHIENTGENPDNARKSSTSSNEDNIQVHDSRKPAHHRKARYMSAVGEESETGRESGEHEMSGGSGEDLAPATTQETRDWTEEDDVRDDYHRILRGL